MSQWFARLNDPTRDVYERRYRLLSAVSIFVLFVWLCVAVIIDGYSGRLLFFAICDLLFIPTMIWTLRTGKVQIGAGGSGIVLVFVMVPVAFFYNGGIYAGAPNWCIIATMFVTLTVKGRLRTFLLASNIAVTILCYIVTYERPDLLGAFTTVSAYVDSLSTLVITGIVIAIMFAFQLHISNQEKDRMEKQQREIEELNRAQNRFFSSMSHEIRTPVNTIIGLNEMILREEISDEVAEDAAQVQAAGKLLLHLVNDILDMSRLESGRMTLTPVEYNLGELLSELVGMFWKQAADKGLELHIDVDPELPATLIGDDMRLKQILINVLNNAIKYTQAGSVTLSLQGKRGEKDEIQLVFSIADTGMGIKKEALPTLFSAFRRVDEDKNRQIEGTGLGLSVVKQLVDLMGGSISVNSVYTKGSTFLIELPQRVAGDRSIGELDLESRQRSEQRTKYVQSFEAPEACILIVDDNPANLLVAAKLLRESGARLDTAASGAEALEKTLTTPYNLIFMDHLMPGMDGIECLHQLRSQVGGLCRSAKVVALTANAGSENRALYAREGFDGYLVKPVSGQELESECVRLLPRELLRIVREDSAIVEQSMSWLSAQTRRDDVLITTDSLADLPDSLLKSHNIAVIPHSVRTQEGVFHDGLEIESTGLVAYMEKTTGTVKAVPPSVEDYEAFFAEQLTHANHILHISISSLVPGSGFTPAQEAARSFHNVTVIDSGHLSSGEGLLALEAARLAKAGGSPEQIIARLEQLKGRIHTSFVVDSLDYMARASLVSQRTLKLTNALMVHPVLRMKKGQLLVGKVHFGSQASSRRRYIASELKKRGAIDRRLLFVTYVGMSQKELGEVRAEIEKRIRFDTLIFQKASPAIAVNCGPGTFGLLYETLPEQAVAATDRQAEA